MRLLLLDRVVSLAEAGIDVAGAGVVRLLSYQVVALVASGQLVRLLRAYEPEPVPAHLVQLAGTRSRPAAAFVALAAERLAARPSR